MFDIHDNSEGRQSWTPAIYDLGHGTTADGRVGGALLLAAGSDGRLCSPSPPAGRVLRPARAVPGQAAEGASRGRGARLRARRHRRLPARPARRADHGPRGCARRERAHRHVPLRRDPPARPGRPYRGSVPAALWHRQGHVRGRARLAQRPRHGDGSRPDRERDRRLRRPGGPLARAPGAHRVDGDVRLRNVVIRWACAIRLGDWPRRRRRRRRWRAGRWRGRAPRSCRR